MWKFEQEAAAGLPLFLNWQEKMSHVSLAYAFLLARSHLGLLVPRLSSLLSCVRGSVVILLLHSVFLIASPSVRFPLARAPAAAFLPFPTRVFVWLLLLSRLLFAIGRGLLPRLGPALVVFTCKHHPGFVPLFLGGSARA